MTHATTRAEREISPGQPLQEFQGGQVGHRFSPRSRFCEFFAQCQLRRLVSGTEKSIVSDSHEPRGKDVNEKATNKLVRRQRHLLLLIMIPVIPPLKRHHTIVHTNNTVVGYGNAVGVAP